MMRYFVSNIFLLIIHMFLLFLNKKFIKSDIDKDYYKTFDIPAVFINTKCKKTILQQAIKTLIKKEKGY